MKREDAETVAKLGVDLALSKKLRDQGKGDLLGLTVEAAENLLRILADEVKERERLEGVLTELGILAPCPHSGDDVCAYEKPCRVCSLLGRC